MRVLMSLLLMLALLLWPLSWVHSQQFSSGLTLQRVVINVSSAATTTLVALVAGQVINVYGWEVFCNGANNLTIQDSTPTTLVPVQNFTGGQGVIRDLRFMPWFATAKGTSLQLVTSTVQQCSGNVYYTQG